MGMRKSPCAALDQMKGDVRDLQYCAGDGRSGRWQVPRSGPRLPDLVRGMEALGSRSPAIRTEWWRVAWSQA